MAGRLAAYAACLAVCLAAHASTPLARPGPGDPMTDEAAYLEPLASVTAIERKTTGWIFGRPSAGTPPRRWSWLGVWMPSRACATPPGPTTPRAALAPCPEAAPAQQRLAELQDARGKLQKAFAEFRYLLHFYPGQAARRRFWIASSPSPTTTRTRAARASPCRCSSRSPSWHRNGVKRRRLLQAGLLQAADRKWDEAVATFERISANHPGTPEAEAAAGEAAHALYRIARRFERDEAVQTRALASLAATLRDYPKHAKRGKLQEELDDLTARRYNAHYEAARFYDSPRFKPETAVTAYEEFLRRFPAAPQAEEVRQRLDELDETGRE